MLLVRYILVFVLFSVTCINHAQITLKNGAEIAIFQGTTITVLTPSDTLFLQDSSTITNNGRILFLNNSLIEEQSGFPVSGSGYEMSIQDTLQPGWNNPGNLGFSFELSAPNSSLILKRFHSDTLIDFSPFNSINRYFTLNNDLTESDFTFRFDYDSTELNGLNADFLKPVNIDPGPQVLNGTDSSFSVSGNADSLFHFTLTAEILNLNTVSDTVLCQGDSLDYGFTSSGLFNADNVYTLWLVNASDTVLLNTSDSIGNFSIGVSDTVPSGYYQIYLQSSSAFITDIFESGITINALPVSLVNFTSPGIYCENDSAILLNSGIPAGGIYSGTGVNAGYFDPNISGTGSFILNYFYTDSNNCSASDTSLITINTVDPVSFASLDTLCENNGPVLLNQASPSGGIYSGTGVTANNFDPAVGSGDYFITYTFTNSYGCTDVDSSQMVVLSSPAVPVITQNINTLVSDPAFSYQWYFNTTPLSGATNQSYDATSNGSYWVEVFNANGCSEISDTVNFVLNSIEENDEITISVYPNPAIDEIRIISENSNFPWQVSIYDASGKLMLSESLSKDGIVNLYNFANGMYLLELKNNEFQISRKIMVQE